MNPVPFYLMRHGAPELTGRLLGHTDCAVTADGIAMCVAQARDLDVAHIVASDLIRTSACARAIAGRGAGERHVTLDRRWRELDFGEWDGERASDIDRALSERFWADPDGAPPPGGERWSTLVARVGEAIETMPAEPVLVVTHGGAIRAALAHLCGFSSDQCWAIDLPYGVVVALSVWPGPPRSAQITALWPA